MIQNFRNAINVLYKMLAKNTKLNEAKIIKCFKINAIAFFKFSQTLIKTPSSQPQTH